MKILFSIILSALSLIICAQTGSNTPWVWIKGSNNINDPAVFGTQGIPNSLNNPGSRAYSITWKDQTGNFWLFGGNGATVQNLNDLWKYNPSTNEWTWVKGSSTGNQPGIYGTKGVSNAANLPGARAGGYGWVDSDGNLWMFGGSGYGETNVGVINDLWKYNPTINEWTWISGSKTTWSVPVYGTQGIPSTSNTPGARYGFCGWKDQAGNFWISGGRGYLNVGSGSLNQLWRFNPLTTEWTWVKGDNIVETPGLYGTKGIANISNIPGSRTGSTSWIDNFGNLWMFGGYGYANSNLNYEELNDLWKYNISTNEWTWINGDNIGNQPSVYGTQGIPSITTKPGGRDGMGSWKDSNGNFWLFGGYDNVAGLANDLWEYDVLTNNWTFVKGDNTGNQLGIYGTQGVPSATNRPGGRLTVISWIDDLYNFWIFGGSGYAQTAVYGRLGDLWKIDGIALIPLKLVNFKGYSRDHENILFWETSQEINTEKYIVERSPDARTFIEIGNEQAAGNSSSPKHYFFKDKTPLNDVNFYRLKMLDIDGKFTYSSIIMIKASLASSDITVFPNPANNILFISLNIDSSCKGVVKILDGIGRNVKQLQVAISENTSFSINVNSLAKGTYYLTVVTPLKNFEKAFIKN